ncbi:SRPBCC family protein [Peristeroidobacter agariperforans]|uniref:SRPBCC family protein n=1 Tax=Peristeroidobacter agariperforans TaxID=268404 RepID=UPI0013005CE7|nr:SRPBCC family protein [Peristeroidobacter agariperforans]
MAASMTREPVLDRSLGWFSVGLGMAELLAPKAMGRMIGVGEQSTVLRMCGVREIVSGVGLLSGRAPATFAMSRVVGDVMDLALLGASLRSPDSNPSRVAATATAVAGVTALDLYASKVELQSSMAEAQQDVPVHASLMINSPPDQVYAFWRKLENLPRFMSHLESVAEVAQQRSEWTARLPGGVQLRWQSEIVEDQPGRLMSWRTVAGSEINHVGSVRFEPGPGGQGTQVKVEIYYGMPGGPAAAKAAQLVAMAPESLVTEDLRRLKQLIETGEIATTQGQPAGKRSMIGRMFGKEES